MKKFLYLLLFIPFVISCDKEKEVQISPTDALTGGKAKFWKVQKWENLYFGDFIQLYPQCYPDDVLNFKKTNLNSQPKLILEWNYSYTVCTDFQAPTGPIDTFEVSLKNDIFTMMGSTYKVLTLNDSIFEIGDETNHIIFKKLEQSSPAL